MTVNGFLTSWEILAVISLMVFNFSSFFNSLERQESLLDFSIKPTNNIMLVDWTRSNRRKNIKDPMLVELSNNKIKARTLSCIPQSEITVAMQILFFISPIFLEKGAACHNKLNNNTFTPIKEIHIFSSSDNDKRTIIHLKEGFLQIFVHLKKKRYGKRSRLFNVWHQNTPVGIELPICKYKKREKLFALPSWIFKGKSS